MNDTKTADRSNLGQANLSNLMVWHSIGKSLSCAQVPVTSDAHLARIPAALSPAWPARRECA
eukprot:scaffold245771_cov43-Tisochrysis_lutea.AAC.1